MCAGVRTGLRAAICRVSTCREQAQFKHAALPQAAVHVNRPPHAFDQRFDDGQANARAFNAATVGTQAVERLKQLMQLFV